MEKKKTETAKGFGRRIQKFLEEWKKSDAALTVACSPGDWIPEALRLTMGARVNLKKGGWAEAVFNGKEIRVEWVAQRV